MTTPRFIAFITSTTAIFITAVLSAQPNEAESSWPKYQLEYNRQFSLICDSPELNLTTTTDHSNSFSQLFWILPSGEQVTGNVERDTFFTSGTHPTGWNLTLLAVDDTDFGEYVCILVRPDQQIYSIKLGINVDGPYFGDLWARYRYRTMVGGIAGGSSMLLIALICAVHHFRYTAEERDKFPGDVTPREVRVKHRSSFTYEYENPTAVYTEEMREIDPEDTNTNDRVSKGTSQKSRPVLKDGGAMGSNGDLY
ncbi:uncharacterized protein LOC135472779 [Liolophura sinensis]|uniref:uncharacterized protein LOC135472779 n=1 Tax=Liolophura sinensis TaxID=3198878 RepID=UPI0031590227